MSRKRLATESLEEIVADPSTLLTNSGLDQTNDRLVVYDASTTEEKVIAPSELLNDTANNGTANTGVTAVVKGDANRKNITLTVDTTLPAIAGGANLAVGKLLYTLPAGKWVINASAINLAITQTQGNITADTPDGGLGTTIASGAVAVLGGTAAFENILTGQTFNDCNGTAENVAVGTQLVINTADNHTIYFNVADGWASSGDAAALLTGTVMIDATYLGP